MKRTDLEKLISLYADGEVDEKTALHVAHLIEINQEAAAIYSTFLKIREQISKTPRVSLPSDFSKMILEKVNRGNVVRPKESKVYQFCKKNRTLVCSAASALLLFLILPLFLFQTPNPDQGEVQTVAVAPVKQNVSEPLKDLPVLKKEETAIASVKDVPLEKKNPSFLEVPIAYAPVPKVQKPDPAFLSSAVFCVLNSAKKDVFFPKFQDQCSALGLTFSTKHRDGKTVLEFQLTQQNLEKLIHWIQSRTDYVSSVRFSEPLKKWRESNTPSDLYDASGKDLHKTVRFEITSN
ncbi:MAG: hypothetical protein Q4G69_05865 [Planctomycetia bacterium]|nr:hypothetical protein [Planctomycetia bacterium]